MAELGWALGRRALCGALTTAAIVAVAQTTPASASSRFDGHWSVLIVTDAGSCDRAYRYALQIKNGRIAYDSSAVDISGYVNPTGHVRVAVSFGHQRASGTGQLSSSSGQGTWTGTSSSSRCSGHWEAERRG